MTDNYTELCEKLRREAKAIMSSFASEDHLFSHFFEAADLIESQAARIAELEKERDALKVAEAAAIERCAKICDEWQRQYFLEECCDLVQDNALKSVASAIRALLPKEK